MVISLVTKIPSLTNGVIAFNRCHFKCFEMLYRITEQTKTNIIVTESFDTLFNNYSQRWETFLLQLPTALYSPASSSTDLPTEQLEEHRDTKSCSAREDEETLSKELVDCYSSRGTTPQNTISLIACTEEKNLDEKRVMQTNPAAMLCLCKSYHSSHLRNYFLLMGGSKGFNIFINISLNMYMAFSRNTRVLQ